MHTNWTNTEGTIPATNREAEITSPAFRGTRKAIFKTGEPFFGWYLTDCTHPAQNCFAPMEGSAWRYPSNQ